MKNNIVFFAVFASFNKMFNKKWKKVTIAAAAVKKSFKINLLKSKKYSPAPAVMSNMRYSRSSPPPQSIAVTNMAQNAVMQTEMSFIAVTRGERSVSRHAFMLS